MPVKLRRGGRILGGSLSWDKPQQLAGFSREGPFNGMALPYAKRLRELERENRRLKAMLADSMLEIRAIKDVLSKKW